MCTSLFSKPKTPAPQPMPSPAPVPTPSESSAMVTGDARRKQLERLRRGLSSTIKTRGMLGTGSDLTQG
jgi:hypothetical protein